VVFRAVHYDVRCRLGADILTNAKAASKGGFLKDNEISVA